LLISVDCPAYFGVSPVEFPRLDAAGRATPSAEDGQYVVRPNDTIDTIGQRLDVSVEAILQANDISDPRSIVPGQVLIIPEDAPAYGVFPPNRELSGGGTTSGESTGFFRQPPATGAAPSTNEYVVQPNDTLDTIGQALNVSVDALRIANGIDDPNSLLPGQVLVIPDDAPAYGVFPAIRATGEAPTGALTVGENEYVVQPNDTLDTIGQTLNVSVEALRLENNITDPNLIIPGLVLMIPEDAPPYGVFPAIPDAETEAIRARIAESGGQEYVVQPNDTLDTIGQEFNVSVVALRVANEIDSALDLLPGQVLIIPANAPVYGVYASINEPAGSQIPTGEQYILQPGDTLDQIAAEKNIDTLCLIEQNGIDDPRYIRAGQIIGIPAGCPPYTGLSATPFRTAVPLPPGGVPTTAPQATPTATP
jgi:LysM repeat protein